MYLLGVIVLFIVNAINGASIEPICSKFSYEEQLLEKMVRLEFFAENMQKDVKTSLTDSKNEINGMIDKQLEMSKNMTDFSASMTSFGRQFGELKENVTIKTEATLKGTSEKVEVEIEELRTNITLTNDKVLKGIVEEAKKQEQKFEEFRTIITLTNDKALKGIVEETKNQEQKFEEFRKNMTLINDKVLKEIVEETKKHEQTIEGIKTNIINSNQKFQTETTEEVKKLSEKIKEVQKSVTDVQKQNLKEMEELFNKKHPLVAFNVYAIAKDYPGSKVMFKNIRLNEGGGFSTTTSMFTAPVSGLYQFNAHICFEKGSELNYYIYIGGIYYARGEYVVPGAASDGKCMSISTVARVQKSQTAHVAGIPSSYIFENVDDINSFSGVLIRAV
ncbi:uncharacterized protein LOC132740182 [Ruditapes philippinarum]|uniref:uncharacterized protein LOC132740182 n=1 Tax=Ruditapes philippinarum TaxID=129788 RepID=UPI00295AA35A|nr:uncharacterized protein LOC132740182 [Ruditapes philippinarum]